MAKDTWSWHYFDTYRLTTAIVQDFLKATFGIDDYEVKVLETTPNKARLT